MSASAAITHAKTLRNMNHYLKTSQGESDECIRPHPLIGGVGQGSGAGPTSMHVQIMPMIETMENFSNGFLMSDPIRCVNVLQRVCVWVDDTMNKEGFSHDMPTIDMLLRLQRIMIKWRQVLRTTGGDLALNKCSVYLITWKFSPLDGSPTMKTISQSPGCVCIPPELPTDKECVILRKDPSSAEKYIGVHISPSGQMTTEYNYRVSNSRTLGEKIRRAPLSRSEATMVYHSRWMAVLNFFLPVTTFPENRCRQIQQPIISALLPKLGYNRHFPIVVRHALRKYGGLEIANVYTEQIVHHLRVFIGTLRQDTDLSKMLRIVLSSYQLFTGSGTLFLNLDFTKYAHLKEGRLTFLWQISNELKLHFDVEDVWIPTLQRDGDGFLMDIFQRAGVPYHILLMLNACRLFLKVLTLSDIVSADGLRILEWVIWPLDAANQCNSSLLWPHQECPHHRIWQVWRDTLRQLLTNNSSQWPLENPLGKWFHVRRSHFTYKYMIHTATNTLWDIQLNTKYYIKDGNVFSGFGFYGTPPNSHLAPATCNITSSGDIAATFCRVTIDSRPNIPPPPPSTPTTFMDYVNALPPPLQCILSNISLPNDDGFSLASDLSTGSVLAASDGSAHTNRGSFGYIITNNDQSSVIQGYGRIPSTYSTPSSQRSEFYGSLALALVLRILSQLHKVDVDVTVPIYIDNSHVVESNISHQTDEIRRGIKMYTSTDMDIQLLIKTMSKDEHITPQWNWIKGHQDETTSELSLEAELNVQADTLAAEGHP